MNTPDSPPCPHTPPCSGQTEQFAVAAHGQEKLLQGKILCVGAGGLGSPAAAYLAAAGVGTLGIVDDDRVDRSNLQRQILHTEARIGQPKVGSAKATLTALNSAATVNEHLCRLTENNAMELMQAYDIIVDGSDNYRSRYLISDTCRRLNLPHVYGAVHRFQGQVAVFWPGQQADNPCYRCLYPEESEAGAGSCETHGVLGVLPGIIGTLQAMEAVKLLAGEGEPLANHLLLYDALSSRFKKIRIMPDSSCRCRIE